MQFDETNYEAIEYHVLKTIVENDAAITPGFELSGLDIKSANEICEEQIGDRLGPEILPLPVSEDGKKVAFAVKDIDLKNLDGVHTWKLMKNAKSGGPAPISERKIKECVSFLVSEGCLKYESDKRFYITPKGVQLFLDYASKLANDYYQLDFEFTEHETEP